VQPPGPGGLGGPKPLGLTGEIPWVRGKKGGISPSPGHFSSKFQGPGLGLDLAPPGRGKGAERGNLTNPFSRQYRGVELEFSAEFFSNPFSRVEGVGVRFSRGGGPGCLGNRLARGPQRLPLKTSFPWGTAWVFPKHKGGGEFPYFPILGQRESRGDTPLCPGKKREKGSFHLVGKGAKLSESFWGGSLGPQGGFWENPVVWGHPLWGTGVFDTPPESTFFGWLKKGGKGATPGNGGGSPKWVTKGRAERRAKKSAPGDFLGQGVYPGALFPPGENRVYIGAAREGRNFYKLVGPTPVFIWGRQDHRREGFL